MTRDEFPFLKGSLWRVRLLHPEEKKPHTVKNLGVCFDVYVVKIQL